MLMIVESGGGGGGGDGKNRGRSDDDTTEVSAGIRCNWRQLKLTTTAKK